MRALETVLLLAALACAVHCRHAQRYIPWEHDAPPRCRQPAAAVSCERVPPHNLLPHPTDCELFYYCVSARAPPLCRQCLARLHFNPRLRVCDYPAHAGCRLRDPQPTDPEPTDPPATDTSAANTTSPESDVHNATTAITFTETVTTENTVNP